MPARPPSKIAQERDQLRAENAALRDLLAAVQETALAGAQAHGKGADHWRPGHWAAKRISAFLDSVREQDTAWLELTAGMFREYVAEITGAGDEPALDTAPCPSVAPYSKATCALAAGHDGHHESAHRPAITWDDDGDLPLPDCATPGCAHPEDAHFIGDGKPIATGACNDCDGCTAYALPQHDEAGAAR